MLWRVAGGLGRSQDRPTLFHEPPTGFLEEASSPSPTLSSEEERRKTALRRGSRVQSEIPFGNSLLRIAARSHWRGGGEGRSGASHVFNLPIT